MIVMLLLSDASAAPYYNYEPHINFLFIDAFPLQIGGVNIYVLICYWQILWRNEPIPEASCVNLS